ncbi:hypothetical protein [Corynebacterium sp. DNF00584]|uniref:hypothetical protein n=1 Tax=Corynebacterium sp. DNF00584 TaxID=1384076 RepID=UPI00079A731E|nr:hypothetical protein [Corynebacterium sp. DNF00584]KXB52749.1 hypothetical protein HMPREF0307_02067 [Corynebacterium sp. DNF00584]
MMQFRTPGQLPEADGEARRQAAGLAAVFGAYVDAGFTRAEALQIIIAILTEKIRVDSERKET